MIPYQTAQPVCGVRPVIYMPDEGMRDMFARQPGGLPEAPLIDAVWKVFGKRNGLLLDIGAHVGDWAIPFAAAGMDVCAFEPNPTFANLLRHSVIHNNVNVLVYECAVSDFTGTAHLTGEDIGGGGASIVLHFDGAVSETVHTLSLDSLGLAPDIIKIDTEGAELDVLRGAVETITKHQPLLLFECWQDERGQRIEDLFRRVDSLGYLPKPTPWQPPSGQEMYLALPK